MWGISKRLRGSKMWRWPRRKVFYYLVLFTIKVGFMNIEVSKNIMITFNYDENKSGISGII